jgi:hypothetical protein
MRSIVKTKRLFLIFCGIAVFGFINYGFIKWLQSGHHLIDVWQALTQDWLLFISVADACLFTLLAFIWLIGEMKKRGFSFKKQAMIFFAVLLTGTSAFFIYLAFRPQPNESMNNTNDLILHC